MHTTRRTKLAGAGCLFALACILQSGCASVAGLQDLQFSYNMRGRTSEAWRNSFTKEQRRTISTDFQAGFKQGFYDVAMNRDCRLPPIAPPKYWSAHYQSCEGQKKIEEWFVGYQQGIAVAQSTGQSGSAEAPVGPGAPVLNKTGCGTCYSPNPCNAPYNSPYNSPCNTPCNTSANVRMHDAVNSHPVEGYIPNYALPFDAPIDTTVVPPLDVPADAPLMESSPSDLHHLDLPNVESVDPVEFKSSQKSEIGEHGKLVPVSFGQPSGQPVGLIGGYGNPKAR